MKEYEESFDKMISSQSMTIEEQLLKIQEIASELEKADIPLEKALEKYEEGVRLVRTCSSQIDKVQKRIMIIETETEDNYD